MGTSQTEQRGLWLGLLAVTMFALSLPMTKLAVGSHDAPLLSPWFSSFGRAAVAGLLSVVYLWYHRARWPVGNQWRTLALIGLGNAIGFPILQTVGLLYVPSSHAAVFNGLLPLATAAIAALIFRQHAPVRFWAWAGLAALFVVLFALWRAKRSVQRLQIPGFKLQLLGLRIELHMLRSDRLGDGNDAILPQNPGQGYLGRGHRVTGGHLSERRMFQQLSALANRAVRHQWQTMLLAPRQ